MVLAFKIARRNLLRRPRRSILTALTLIAGYFVLSLGFAITEGSYNTIIEKFTCKEQVIFKFMQKIFLINPLFIRL